MQLHMSRCAANRSAATVSKALNGRSDISEEARRTIENAVAKNGYVGRNTQRRHRLNIEVVFQSFENMWALEVLKGVLSEAKPLNIGVTVTEIGNRSDADASWVSGILNRQPIGVILIFSNLAASERSMLSARHIPFVIFDPAGDPYPSDFSVQADNWTGGILATRHLISLGHKRIGVITGPDTMLCSRARLDGYMAALAEHGITSDNNLIARGDFTTVSGYNQSIKMLDDADNRPTAIFAGSDLQAMGTYEAARQLGIRIPEDLSVVGFDDIQTSAFMGPSLTTIHQPLAEMTQRAARIILGKAHSKMEQRHIIMPTSLIIRDSTRPPLLG